MPRHIRLCLAACLLSWTSVAPCAAPASRPSSPAPNVIVLLTDDQGYGDLSCHGNPVLKTPNIDRLHAQSVRFTDFHVEPMCTPTRAQLMTGLDAFHTAAMNVSSGRCLLRRDLATMADVFAASGYQTGMFGKWHLGDTYPYRPMDRGFQKTLCFGSSYIGSAADAWNNDYFNDRYRFNDQLRRVKGYCTDVFFDEAIRWLRERAADGRPFFLYLPTNAAHGPLFVPARYREQYERLLADRPMNDGYRRSLARFFGMIANLDENVGRLEKTLDETGLRENTVVIYMTDNGGTVGVDFYNAGMRGRKTTLWEGGHRVPCFVRWPAGGVGGGRDVAELAEVQDLLPTLIELCGLKTPAGAKFDGTSLAGLARGTQKRLDDRMLVVQFSRLGRGQRPTKNDAAVLWRRWRLIGGSELYNLADDPHQDQNVFADHPEVVERMQKHYDRWWSPIEPTLDTFQPSVVGSDKQNPTRLCASEWADVFLDQGGQVRAGPHLVAKWHIEAEQPGRYEFALCRWPRGVKATMTEATPAHRGEDCVFGPGVALPIAKARLRVAGQDVSKAVEPTDHEATFTVTLPKGPATVETWFYDGDGKVLTSAYYVYVRRSGQ